MNPIPRTAPSSPMPSTINGHENVFPPPLARSSSGKVFTVIRDADNRITYATAESFRNHAPPVRRDGEILQPIADEFGPFV